MNTGLLLDVDQVMVAAIATGLFRSRCTVYAPDGVLGPSGAPSGTYVNVPGILNVLAMDAPAPPVADMESGTEVKTMSSVLSLSARHVLLERYFASLSPRTNWGDIGWIAAMVDRTGNTTLYDITGADADSQQTQTRLRLQKAAVGGSDNTAMPNTVQFVTVSLSATQLLAMDVTPVELVAAQGSGKVIVPQGNVILQYEFGTVPYTVGSVGFQFMNGLVDTYTLVIGGDVGLLALSVSSLGIGLVANPSISDEADVSGQALLIKLSGSGVPITDGDGTLKITLGYSVVTL